MDVRIGASFVSVEQARRNLVKEIPDGTTLQPIVRRTRGLDRAQIQGEFRDSERFETFALLHLAGFQSFGFAMIGLELP